MPELPAGTVTLLFTDIEGSTRLLQRTGDGYPELLATHRELLRAAFERHGGRIVDDEGDAFFVAFASAHDAAGAAADAQRALAAHEWPDGNEIRVRIGLHTGEPARVDGRYVGLDVRFQRRHLAEPRLKDFSGPQRLSQPQVGGAPGEFPPLKTLDNRPTNL